MIEWNNGYIKVEPPKRPKKLTATRFATVLGLNPWSTPFEVWCEVTRTYAKPFEDTIYTIAGKTIEPKQIEYMRRAYFMTNLKTPTDIYGKDYFNKTYGDFYGDIKVLGGMWDSLLVDENGRPDTVIEFKTTKRAEDWQGDVPEYYALQASLYAYLLGVDDVIMVASFLETEDYEHPENFVLTPDNTITYCFKVSERYPTFEKDYVKPALKWWDAYVETGISPDFDETKDAEILKELRKNSYSPDSDLAALIEEAEGLQDFIDESASKTAEAEKRLKVIKDIIKKAALEQFRDGDTKVAIEGSRYEWTVSKVVTSTIDKKALEKDGLLEKYSKTADTFKIQPKLKENK